jgi:hypothetical protein
MSIPLWARWPPVRATTASSRQVGATVPSFVTASARRRCSDRCDGMAPNGRRQSSGSRSSGLASDVVEA